MNIPKLLPALLLLLGVAASPLRAQDDSNKSLGEKTSEGVEKAKDNTVEETHKVANTTRHESHKVANTTRHESHKVANTTRHETGKKADASGDANEKTNNAAVPQ